MKTARFLFTIIAFGSLTLGLGYAGEPSSQSSERNPHETHATSVKVNDNGHASGKSIQAGPVNTRSKRAPVTEVHQPGLKKAATAANKGLMMNKIRNHHEQPARLPVGGGITAPSARLARDRGAAAATIGGAAASSAKHPAAALSGADIKRKP
jgi:3-keto-L-gulonate-6-phosphate decarboxylase